MFKFPLVLFVLLSVCYIWAALGMIGIINILYTSKKKKKIQSKNVAVLSICVYIVHL